MSCAQLSFTLEPDNGLCNTHDECACESSLSMSRPVYRLKADAVQVWHVDGVWLKHSSWRGGQFPPPWRLSALPTHTSDSRKCQINTFKNSLCSFEIPIWYEKVSTSSLQCRCPSFSWPSWTPCRTSNLQLSLDSSPCHHALDLSTNSRSLG